MLRVSVGVCLYPVTSNQKQYRKIKSEEKKRSNKVMRRPLIIILFVTIYRDFTLPTAKISNSHFEVDPISWTAGGTN